MKILDIGCGRKKIKGAIGLDFSSLSDADITIDLNVEKFPFDDNSFDFLYSSHTLEHLTMDGFWNVMNEAYRILKPVGQFMITVPYFHTRANLANPFHNNQICFNEHTFRFLSSEMTTPCMAPHEYATPSCPQWGLRYSANAELNMEWRTLAIKYYYFPEFRDASESEKFHARATRDNVVDQISYSLQVVKPCPIRPETGPVATGEDPSTYVLKQITHLKNQIQHLNTFGTDNALIKDAESFLNDLKPEGDVYKCGTYYIPVSQLVYVLDDYIQPLQSLINQGGIVKAAKMTGLYPLLKTLKNRLFRA